MQSASQIPERSRQIKVVVATSVMLSFISFWRAAAIVLNDLASSAFYAGGIAEQAAGRAAPWFILAVMLFSYAVRAVYVESCAMFTRGGVYRVVKEAMGGTLAKVSVSALMFDYILTGPISGVSAGQYVVGLVSQCSSYFGHPWIPGKDLTNHLAAAIAVLVTLYFWWRNTKGMHESSDDALKIMKITTVMVVLMIGWSVTTLALRPNTRRLPPPPTSHSLSFNDDSIGWMPKLVPQMFKRGAKVEFEGEMETRYQINPQVGHDWLKIFAFIGILIGFGHSVLAMSGEESLAQVNRELEEPKHRNLMRAGTVIFVYSLLFTSLVSFFAYAIIPDGVRRQYYDNLISGIAVNLAGPESLKLIFQAFIVIVGFLILAGAVNTAIIGSNGVLNRVSEDGVLTDWFRHPHRRFGTTHRMINLIVALQLLTIIGSRGNIYMLGEAYAFGVIWSFALKGLAVLVLRFKDPSPREWRVPLNLRIGRLDLPIGLGLITLALFLVAGVNLITKEVATISGIVFTCAFFLIFYTSERINARKRGAKEHVEMDQFKLHSEEAINAHAVNVRPGNALCLVRDYNTLGHLKQALQFSKAQDLDIAVMTVRILKGPDSGYEKLNEKDLFTTYEQLLFSRVVSVAEKQGRHVELLVIPSSDVFQAIALTAAQLQSSQIIAGRSSVMAPARQATLMGDAWERLSERPKHPVCFVVLSPDGTREEYYLGAHPPRLSDEDVFLIHKLWLELSQEMGAEKLHHRDVVALALKHLSDDLHEEERRRLIDELHRQVHQ